MCILEIDNTILYENMVITVWIFLNKNISVNN